MSEYFLEPCGTSLLEYTPGLSGERYGSLRDFSLQPFPLQPQTPILPQLIYPPTRKRNQENPGQQAEGLESEPDGNNFSSTKRENYFPGQDMNTDSA